jgi:hypothetical protein
VNTAAVLIVAALELLLAAGVPAVRPAPQTEPPPEYMAFGAGHLLREVSRDGRYVTLEDASRWEVNPQEWFKSAEWEPLASMTVRAAGGENGFNCELINTTEDEGVLAKLLPRPR